jgi:hypothetical protein
MSKRVHKLDRQQRPGPLGWAGGGVRGGTTSINTSEDHEAARQSKVQRYSGSASHLLCSEGMAQWAGVHEQQARVPCVALQSLGALG